jgi:hypothetical protein
MLISHRLMQTPHTTSPLKGVLSGFVMLRVPRMVDTDTRADRKAKRFPGRIVWVVTDGKGVDHCLLYCKIKGKINALKSYEPETQKIVTLKMDGR